MDRDRRDQLIEALQGLAADDDAIVVENARRVATLADELGLDWAEALPRLGGGGGLEADFDHGSIDFDTEDDVAEGPAAAAVDDGNLGALLQRLTAQAGVSVETRTELEEFARDLAAGTLDPGDRRYIVALAGRLGLST
ncbi:hypothetical protein D3874_10045 [Oleomonas cavernae]|uniref:Uncharacterized protein n=1 Tax=Oleomonas cavernae TaxID=2320859 RepID=A0A418WBE4_9PROT|nr:hypothetical protein [Oleomonas cavernae]RJF87325.1 hypothetical protein D3874_10045 [Oleomonas cavernae]